MPQTKAPEDKEPEPTGDPATEAEKNQAPEDEEPEPTGDPATEPEKNLARRVMSALADDHPFRAGLEAIGRHNA